MLDKISSSLRVLLSITLCLSALTHKSLAESSLHCQSWLVQSIPTDMPHLPRIQGVLSTADVLRWMAGNSSERLDMIVQYWQLLARPDDSRSGDYGFSEAEMERFGAAEGSRVYESIQNAADRNVTVRIIQHSGVYPDYTEESSSLASGRPNVENLTLLLSDWWGSGIVHAKVWISDGRDVYIGSANNDWKSLTQVKEVGIYIANCPKIAKKVEKYFNNLRKLAFLNASSYTRTVWDQQWQISRKVPCWSHLVNTKDRCRSPLPYKLEVPHVDGYPRFSDPSMIKMPMETPGCNYSTSMHHNSYLSFAPPELSVGKFQTDEQAWVDTIKSVNVAGTVRISTMDWLGQSQYADKTVYWPTLSSAISEVVFSKHATVRLLVAYWSHFINNTDQYLKSLLYSNNLCASSKYNKCAGKIEIKYYMVPGYNLTGAAVRNGTKTGNIYPGFSRVNHSKYAVSDVRAHIGTSNLIWDYFYNTAGVSFGTYSPPIVSQLQAIFDADWNSPYTVPVEPLSGGRFYSSR
ncbi:hypothetical protein Sjap_019024 [Stephania japonica]|uniref:PLD phosphodiesterase domain-containing protein n=1 Tax=Stephania japonica TaxID=461633 RepID=A0AAP0EXY0_9MAGN